MVWLWWPSAVDTLIGIQGDGFVVLAADALLHRSVVVMKQVGHVVLADGGIT